METIIIGDQRLVIPPDVRAQGDAAVGAFLDEHVNPTKTKAKTKAAAPAEGA